jgi:phosphatidylglycerophosphatase A
MTDPESASAGRPPRVAERTWWNPAVLAATCGGLGRVPAAPGTFGALLGTLVAAGLAAAAVSPGVEAAALVAANVLGVPLCTRAARLLGRGDPGQIVYDECASLPLALLVLPAAARTPAALAAAFVLHRIFDVNKPFPLRRLERLPRGLGIMADDWGAAGYAAAGLAIGRGLGWL